MEEPWFGTGQEEKEVQLVNGQEARIFISVPVFLLDNGSIDFLC
jgi:hypothetical protein